MTDFDFDDFEEIIKGGGGPKISAPAVFRGSRRKGTDTRFATLTIYLDLCEYEVDNLIDKAERVTIAYSPKARAYRIKPDPRGSFSLRRLPKDERIRSINLAFPAGLEFAETREAAEIAEREGAVFVTIPASFWPIPVPGAEAPAAQRGPPVDVSAGILGDPGPNQSALSRKAAR